MSHHYAKVAAYDQDQDYDSYEDRGQRQSPSAAAGFSSGLPPAWTTTATTTTSASPTDLYPQTAITTAATTGTTYALSEMQVRENDDAHQQHLQQQLFTVPMTPPSNSSTPQSSFYPSSQPSTPQRQVRSSPSHQRPRSSSSSNTRRNGANTRWRETQQSLRRMILNPFLSLSSLSSSSPPSASTLSSSPPSSSTSTSGSYTLIRDTEHDGGAPSSSSSSPSSSSATTHQGSGSSSASGPGRLQPTRSSNRPSVAVDGVFSNISAKPEVEGQKDDERRPPTYESAVQDVTPPYFEMTVMSPSSQYGGRGDSVFGDEILVDGLPVGNILQFLWNIAVAGSFQFLGALLTYLLHNSHASKSGSMAGLGITLLNFGIRMRGGLGTIFNNDTSTNNPDPSTYTYNPIIGEITQISKPALPSMDDTGYIGAPPPPGYGYEANADSREMDWLQMDLESHWVSMVLMMAGWMVLVKALAEYAIAKRTESIIKARLENEDLEDGGLGDEVEEEEGMEELHDRLRGGNRDVTGGRIVGYISSEDDV
ncbi:hypothetical protein BGZ88_009637 [Linnemannia elongata]|nr:hypothetical protein BGZ88_009637 [Linnemannia elongata]